MLQPSPTRDPLALRDAWRSLTDSDRAPRQRDAALLLGVSEAQLVASQCGDSATRLEPDWLAIVQALESLGTVMALTRNEYVVIEKDGVYRDVSAHGPMAQVLGNEIDLRLFLSRWSSGFALCEAGARGVKRSLQFFDASGTAVHKVFLREASDVEAYGALVRRFAASEQPRSLAVEPTEATATTPDSDIDVDGLRRRWSAMTDTHEFFGVLREFKVERLQALRLAGPTCAREVGAESLKVVLECAAATRLPIMVFAGNRGCIEIHSGPVERVVAKHGWLNVLDPGFNLHVRETGIARAWVVHKPSEHGVVSSLEVFEPHGENIAMLFAHRKDGATTVDRWKDLLRTLE